MKSLLFGTSGAFSNNSGTWYLAPVQTGNNSSGAAYEGTENRTQQVMPAAGTISRFAIRHTNAPGGSASWTYTIRKNGVSTAAVAVLSGSNTTVETTEEVDFVAGDLISIMAVPTTSPSSAGSRRWTIEVEMEGSPVLYRAGVGSSSFAGGVIPFTGQSGTATLSGTHGNIIPCAGVIKSFRAFVGTAPGGSNAWIITLQKNGVATALTATIGPSATTVASTDANISVAAGDIVRWNITKTSAPPNEIVFAISALFEPTTDGEQPLMGLNGHSFPSQSTTDYSTPHGLVQAWDATEANIQFLMFERTVTNFIGQLTVAPGSGRSRALNFRAGSTSAHSVTLTDTAQVTSSVSYDIVDATLVSIQQVPTGTPANSFVSWGATLYIEPESSGDTGIPVGYWFPGHR
jgi:hypothetical protein